MTGNLDRNEQQKNPASQARMKRKLIMQEKRNARQCQNSVQQKDKHDNHASNMSMAGSCSYVNVSTSTKAMLQPLKSRRHNIKENSFVSTPTTSPTSIVNSVDIDNGGDDEADETCGSNTLNMSTQQCSGAKLDKSFNDGRGPSSFRIQCETCHLIGSLLSMPEIAPKFAQLYIYDTKNEIQNRLAS
ncbi:hypothetical protein Lal_00012612 [Lupinus albus]|nr:hypothetical protein Lal_00012612 [Lupinus albus]